MRFGVCALVALVVLAVLGLWLGFFDSKNDGLRTASETNPAGTGGARRDLLAPDAAMTDFALSVSLPAVFRNDVDFQQGLTSSQIATLSGGLVTNNQNGDFGTGRVFAANIPPAIVSSLTAGTGIGISLADPQVPSIANTGVLSLQGATGAVSLSAGTGISISGLTIASTLSAPAASNSFATIAVSGQTSLSAGSATDTLTFAEGTGITVTTNTGTKAVTISASGVALSQWTTTGSDISYTTGNVGIGTTAPVAKLHLTSATTGKALAIFNETGDQALFTASASGTTRFTIASSGTLTASSYGAGVAQFSSAGVLTSSALNLAGGATLITGTLPVANGGTGATTLTDLIALGTQTTGNYVATITGNAQISVSGSGSETAAVSLAIAADSIGDSQLAFNTGQALTTASSPTFSGLSLTSLTLAGDTVTDLTGTGLQLSAGALQTTLGTSVDLASEVTGILPLANGGTNANLTAVQGGIVYSGGSAMAIAAAGNAGQVLLSGGSGAPTWVDAATVGTNYWQRNLGTLAPLNITDDLLLGGTSSVSARFAFLNTAAGTPTASFSGNLALAVPTGANPSAAINILNGGSLNVQTSVGGDAGLSSRLFIANTGNVGIGTTSPGYKLSVVQGGSGDNGIHIQSGNSTNTVLAKDGVGLDLNAGQVSHGITFSTQGTPKAVINSTGNVGIGTTNPGNKLDVSGAVRILAGNALYFQNATGDNNGTISATGGAGSANLAINASGGNVGIGTTVPLAKLQIQGSGSDIVNIGNRGGGATDSYIYMSQTNGTSYASIGSYKGNLGGGNSLVLQEFGGNVGIGTTNPGAQLDLSTDAARKLTTTTWTTGSDARIKTSVQTISDALDIIGRVRPVGYHYTPDYRAAHPSIVDTDYYSFIAQEYQQVFPQSVTEIDGLLYLNSSNMIPYAIAGIKELDRKLALQESRVTALAALAPAAPAALPSSVPAESSILAGNVAALGARVDQIAQLAHKTASDAAFLKEMMTAPLAIPGDTPALAHSLAALDVADAATISGTLNVLGRTTVGDLGVTGQISAGLLAIDGLAGELDTLAGPLKLQAAGLGGVEFVGGKLTIDKEGNLHTAGQVTAETVTTKKLDIDTADPLAAAAGKGEIPAGEDRITIQTHQVTSSSLIFVTATAETDVPVVVDQVLPGRSFTVEVVRPQPHAVTFNWWVIN